MVSLVQAAGAGCLFGDTLCEVFNAACPKDAHIIAGLLENASGWDAFLLPFHKHLLEFQSKTDGTVAYKRCILVFS